MLFREKASEDKKKYTADTTHKQDINTVKAKLKNINKNIQLKDKL